MIYQLEGILTYYPRNVDEYLRLLQAFQFNEKHGEVCPASWKPGSETIKPDIEKSKDYW